MKQILRNLCIVSTLLLALTSCDTDAEYTTYSGPNYIMFADTLFEFPVVANGENYNVEIVATRACDYDRTLAVEVVDSISNAIEGRHYSLESNTVVIKAGELVGNLQVKGYHDNIAVTDSLGFALRLITSADTQWDTYGVETNVLLKKACKFDINAFTGPCFIALSTYLQNYTNLDGRLTYSVVDPENENTIIIKDYFYDGYDCKVKFITNDILNPLIKFEDQPFGSTAEAFGTLYGEEGIINMYQPSMYTSYYSSCEKFILQYMTLYVPSMEYPNTVGIFVNAVEWISEDEAEKLRREGY